MPETWFCADTHFGHKTYISVIVLHDTMISLENPFEKIREYPKPWHEQETCLKAIDSYERGERFKLGGD